MVTQPAPDVAILDNLIEPASLPRSVSLSRVKVAKNGILRVSSNAVSKHRHGSVCARIIASRLRSVSILGIDIFGARRVASLDRLLIGMEYAIRQKPLIIHLSIGLARHRRMDELEEICRQAYDHGIILIAAAS